ncbi:MAG: roadblock/LC7 domain-containing protein [Anaerolineales bacterium]|nr:MAG: roadblock/LC7 domain-containing protein [Anaerolineales bacterium]
MESILEHINAVVGVTGCFVCDSEGEVLASVVPGVFDGEVVSSVGRTAMQTILGLQTTRRRRVNDLDLLYREGRIVVKSLREGCLCILCVRNINVPLLNLTANLAVKKLRERLKAPSPAKMKAPGRAIPPELAVDGTFFAQMEHELTKILGPIATMIMDDEVAALGAAKDSFPRDRLAELVEKISAEIADEDKRASFQQTVLKAIETLP